MRPPDPEPWKENFVPLTEEELEKAYRADDSVPLYATALDLYVKLREAERERDNLVVLFNQRGEEPLKRLREALERIYQVSTEPVSGTFQGRTKYLGEIAREALEEK